MRNALAQSVAFGPLIAVVLAGCGILSNPAAESVREGEAAAKKNDWDLALCPTCVAPLETSTIPIRAIRGRSDRRL
jgi:hypothetical protein